jgi:hypothetical protein
MLHRLSQGDGAVSQDDTIAVRTQDEVEKLLDGRHWLSLDDEEKISSQKVAAAFDIFCLKSSSYTLF